MRWWGGEGDEFHQPSLRCVIGPITVLTLEFDPPDNWSEADKLDAFETQLRWLRRAGDTKATRPIEAVLKWVKGFSDFRALCVTYSGGKSIHFHFVFDTSDLCATHPQLRDQYRPAFKVSHSILSDSFTSLLSLKGCQPDPRLNEPERFRRLPNGMRHVSEGKKHLFDVPDGTDIQQSVLFEEVLAKAPKGATKRMFDPVMIQQLADTGNAKRSKKSPTSTVGSWRSQEEHDFWVEQAKKLLSGQADAEGFPRASHFEMNGNTVMLKLFACEGDQNAGGVMFENSNRPIFTGGKQPKQQVSIGLPLGHHMQKWQRQWSRQNPSNLPKLAHQQVVTPIVESPVDLIDIDRARCETSDEIRSLAHQYKTILIKGPTGFGKTYSLLRLLPELVRDYRKRELKAKEASPSFKRDHVRGARSAVATSSYDQAREKCDQFNAMHDPSVAVGIVFRSFNQLYSDALIAVYGDDFKDHMITRETVSKTGKRSVLSAIRLTQPDIWDLMKTLHADMLRPLQTAPKDAVCVLFTVHGVLHQWTEGGLSPLLSNPDFFETEVDQLWTLREQTALVVAVQDEVSDADFLRLSKLQTVQWCEELFADNPEIWLDEYLHLSDAHRHWKLFHDAAPQNTPSFQDVMWVRDNGLSSANVAGVGPVEAYCHKTGTPALKMYQPMHRSNFVYHKRFWWKGLARHTFMLTTEHLPTNMYRSATSDDPSAAIYDISIGVHPHGVAEVKTMATLPSTENHTLALDLREDRPDLFVVANKVADIERSLSPFSAKGVNHLADEDILQIMNFIDPSEYARLQTINVVYGLGNAIRLRHIDQFNQTAGRNLGCRYRGKAHLACMPSELWKFLRDGPKTDFSFMITESRDANSRRDQKANAKRSLLDRLAHTLDEFPSSAPKPPSDVLIDRWAEEAGLYDDEVVPFADVLDRQMDQEVMCARVGTNA
jgi:hypothetical protein